MRQWQRWIAETFGAIGLVVVGGMTGSAAGPGAAVGAPPAQTVLAAQAAPPSFQPDTEAKHVSIAPCRIVDSRSGFGLATSGQSRNYVVTGTTGFAPQGGHPGGCGIPAGATAITATISAVSPTRSGFLRAWPSGQPEPGATVVNYSTVSISTGATVALNRTAAQSLTVKNYGGPTHLVIDVFGYSVAPLAGFISPSGAPYSGSSRIIGAAKISTGVFEVQFDRPVRYCAATATAYVSNFYASSTTWYDSTRPDTVRVYVWDANGAPTDQYFYLQVDC